MTNDHDPDPVRALFSSARRLDASVTPNLDDLLARPARPRPSRFARPGLLLGSASLLATAVVVAIAFVFPPTLLQEPAPDPVFNARKGLVLPPPAPPPPPFEEAEVKHGVAVAGSAPGAPRETRAVERAAKLSKPESATAGAPLASPSPNEYLRDLPVAGRYYQNGLALAPGVQDVDGDGNPNVHAARDRDFKAAVVGVSNNDPLTGQWLSYVNSDSIQEIKVVTAGAGAKFPRAQGGFVQGVQAQPKDKEIEAARESNTERYGMLKENEFLAVADNPLSTFSIDVDTASYSVVRRFLKAGQLPPANAVRIEELINYFPYSYPQPTGKDPFSVNVEIASCPWSKTHRLARIGLHGREVRRESTSANLVFLIDVSGSMDSPEKLPLLKSALLLLVDQLGASDQVAIVVYAGASGLVLPSTSGSHTSDIRTAIEMLGANGGTNGGEGLKLAYKVAREHIVQGGVNRVILATDGDFNVGVTDQGELMRLVEDNAKAGVALTALGFGMGNYNDDMLETLADHGNGNHFYIDNENEARKVLVEQVGGTLVTIAKDVKIQVEFNPRKVGAYRLLGYENRMLAKEDFNDDRKDAGEIGSGHDVTALYELIPPGEALDREPVDELKYQAPAAVTTKSDESLTVKLRYKKPDGDKSRLLSVPATDSGIDLDAASEDTRFAAAVAAFGMVLRDSSHRGTADLDAVARLATGAKGADPSGYRSELRDLVERTRGLIPR